MMVAKAPVNVLISGENGTGKELLARMIHVGRKGSGSPFVPVNCACIPENLAESEFFGHCQGAFTGADHARKGKFEEAEGGSLFLDEIGELPYMLQAKFLRALEQGEGTRLGSNTLIRYDFRLISATNKQLKVEVEKGRFREDLYFRLFSIEINVPPLRERREDILPLAMSFLKRTNERFGKKVAGFSSPVLQLYESFHWPGNVRQLLKEVERGVVLTEDGALIGRGSCSQELLAAGQETAPAREKGNSVQHGLTMPDSVRQLEMELIKRAMAECSGNKSRAADKLGITRQGLLKKMKRYNMQPR
jgi:transcriptional regulator with PAS, ATPase and Fis domain